MEFLKTIFRLNGQQSSDFYAALPEQFAQNTVRFGETIGETAGAIVKPTANAVSKPLFAAAVIAVVVGAVVYRKKLGL